jgi:Coenzyme A transferase
MDKVVTVEQALAGVTDGATLAVGGFGLCGLPSTWIAALHRSTVTDLRIVSNKCGIGDWGLGLLLGDRRISRVTASYVGRTREFARQYLASELEVEPIPQGTLAEGCARADAGFPRSTRQPVPAPSPPTPGELKCCPTRSTAGSHFTWSASPTPGSPSARCSTSTHFPTTAKPTESTNSCSQRHPCPSPARRGVRFRR